MKKLYIGRQTSTSKVLSTEIVPCLVVVNSEDIHLISLV